MQVYIVVVGLYSFGGQWRRNHPENACRMWETLVARLPPATEKRRQRHQPVSEGNPAAPDYLHLMSHFGGWRVVVSAIMMTIEPEEAIMAVNPRRASHA